MIYQLRSWKNTTGGNLQFPTVDSAIVIVIVDETLRFHIRSNPGRSGPAQVMTEIATY